MSEIHLYILFGIVLSLTLLALAWHDIQTFRLPNYLTYPLVGVGFCQAYILPTISLKNSLIGALVAYLGFVAVEKTFRYFYKKDGLGRGDAKLLAAGGAWCGWVALPHIILIASLCGIVFTQLPSQKEKRDQGHAHIAFGPFLCFAILIIWVTQLYFLWR